MAQRIRMSEFWYLYGQTFRQMGRLSLWSPLLIGAVLAAILAFVHYYLFSPVTGSLVGGWVRLVNADLAPMFVHYPIHFALMPYFFGIAQLVMNIVIEAFLFGIVIDLLISLYRGEKPAFMVSVKHALQRYFKLTLFWVILIAILYFLNRYFNAFVEDVIGYSLQDAPRRQMMAQLSVRGLTVLAYALCIFVLPSIMVGGRSYLSAVKRGLGLFLKHPFAAFALVLIPYLIGFVPSWLISDPNRIVANFYPELVFYLILISIGLDILVNFILLGTTLKFYMDQST
jgi:hypothetical protein